MIVLTVIMQCFDANFSVYKCLHGLALTFIYLLIYYEVVHRVHIYIENKVYEIAVLNIKSHHQISNNFVHLFPGEVVIHRSKPTLSNGNDLLCCTAFNDHIYNFKDHQNNETGEVVINK